MFRAGVIAYWGSSEIANEGSMHVLICRSRESFEHRCKALARASILRFTAPFVRVVSSRLEATNDAPRRLPLIAAGKLFSVELLSGGKCFAEISSFSFLVLFGNCKPKSSARLRLGIFFLSSSPRLLSTTLSSISYTLLRLFKAETVQKGLAEYEWKVVLRKSLSFESVDVNENREKLCGTTSRAGRRREKFPFSLQTAFRRSQNNKVCQWIITELRNGKLCDSKVVHLSCRQNFFFHFGSSSILKTLMHKLSAS